MNDFFCPLTNKKFEFDLNFIEYKHSFIHGLNPQEFYFHAMSGREGVTDKVVVSVKGGCLIYQDKQYYHLVFQIIVIC